MHYIQQITTSDFDTKEDALLQDQKISTKRQNIPAKVYKSPICPTYMK